MPDVLVPDCVAQANPYRGRFVATDGERIVKQSLREDVIKLYYAAGCDIWVVSRDHGPRKVEYND